MQKSDHRAEPKLSHVGEFGPIVFDYVFTKLTLGRLYFFPRHGSTNCVETHGCTELKIMLITIPVVGCDVRRVVVVDVRRSVLKRVPVGIFSATRKALD